MAGTVEGGGADQRPAPESVNAQVLQKRKRRQLFVHRTAGGITQIRYRAPRKI